MKYLPREKFNEIYQLSLINPSWLIIGSLYSAEEVKFVYEKTRKVK